jgi:dipeptidyl aminopeptidase/acylaminoacyl peptidase
MWKLGHENSPLTRLTHLWPDGRWIVFEAVTVKEPASQSVLYVMSAKGGPWIPISAGKHWDDKPRWSPDGRIIYFVSEERGFFNVWGIHFYKEGGTQVGRRFRVTKFATPDLMVPTYIPPIELCITKNRLVLNLVQVSGSIWVLENLE